MHSRIKKSPPGRARSSLLLLLLLTAIIAPSALQAETMSGAAACGGNSTVDALGARAAKGARSALAELQAAVRSNDREKIAGMIKYPLLILRSGKRTRIRQRQAFLAAYEQVFTTPVRRAILRQQGLCLIGNSLGAMVGEGEVWFREQPGEQWKIITINESASFP